MVLSHETTSGKNLAKLWVAPRGLRGVIPRRWPLPTSLGAPLPWPICLPHSPFYSFFLPSWAQGFLYTVLVVSPLSSNTTWLTPTHPWFLDPSWALCPEKSCVVCTCPLACLLHCVFYHNFLFYVFLLSWKNGLHRIYL